MIKDALFTKIHEQKSVELQSAKMQKYYLQKVCK